MECLGCGYDLRASPAGPCPECGRMFDPTDSDTYGPRNERGLDAGLLSAAAIAASMPLLWLVFVHLTLIAARIDLGRWPHRYGADDPTQIGNLTTIIYYTTFALQLLVFLSFLFDIGLVALAVADRSWRSALLVLAILFVSWLVLFLVLRFDPAEAIVWFGD